MNNKIGVYYGFLAGSDCVDWADCLKRTSAAGLDILEMSAPKLLAEAPEKRREFALMARDLGLQLTFATGLPFEGDISSDDPKVRHRGINLLIDQIKMINQMGGLSLGGILTGVSKNFPPEIEKFRDLAVDNAILSLKEVAKAAEDCDVNIGVEVVNRFESPLVNTSEEGLRVVQGVDSNKLGLLLDVFHMNIEEVDLGRAIRMAGCKLTHFHISENNRALPGHGHIDWKDTVKALNDADYKGAIVMEALSSPDGTMAGRLNIWRRLHEYADKDLALAVDMLRGLMAESTLVSAVCADSEVLYS